jgi:hypothetical protein
MPGYQAAGNLPVRAIWVGAKARMPEGHPHASWAHVGAFWPAVPASDDAIQLAAADYHSKRPGHLPELFHKTYWL